MEKETKSLRERLRIKEQVEEQMQIIRWAWVEGKIDVVSRGIEMLKILLWQEFSKDIKDKFTNIEYKEVKLDKFYTQDDKDAIKRFGELEGFRIRQLSAGLEKTNRERFFFAAGQKLDICMEACKKLGIGFENEEDAYMSHDKKKQTISGKK